LTVNAAHAIKQRQQDEPDLKGKIVFRSSVNDGRVRIEISDNGCGIKEDIAGKIFNPFFTTKQIGEGTGQGLSIVHSIVTERHKGEIDFETSENQGTTFIISLPVE